MKRSIHIILIVWKPGEHKIMILFSKISLHFFVISESFIKFRLIKIRPQSISEIIFRISRLIQEIPRMADISSCTDDEIRR